MMTVTEAQVCEHLPMTVAIELVARAFEQLADGTAVNHSRLRMVLPTGSMLHYMAAGNADYFGIKVYSSNPKTGAHFTFLLYRSEDGTPLATFEANQLGQIRTGAASGYATKHLAREDASTLGMIGVGFQAESQVRAMAAVRDLKDIRVWSRSEEKRHAFVAKFPELPVRAAASAREAVENADIVVTATNSKEPVLEGDWIAPGTHVNATGANWANRRELPSDLVLKADLVVIDNIEAGKLEAGDLLLAGLPEHKWLELKKVAAGTVSRSSGDQITIFKSNGIAIEDVVTAGYVYERLLG